MITIKDLLAFDSWLITAFIGFTVYYLVDFVIKIRSYPRGPLPLPILGNLLLFRGPYNDPPPAITFMELAKKYGPMFTIWVGSTPIIVVNNYELNNEASVVKRNDFIDRSDGLMNQIFRGETENIFSSSGPVWDALRKVGFAAARKFAINERLPDIISDTMDEATQLMLKEKQPLNPILFIDLVIYNVLASVAYGRKYEMNDKEFLNAKRFNDEFYDLAGNGLISEFVPWLRPFYYGRELKLKEITKVSVDITRKHYLEHKKDFTPGIIRDFTDCVLEAKEDSIKEDSSHAIYLTDNTLYMVVSDLFLAGTDTLQTAMRWALLILSNDPKLQEKIHKEIIDNIGDRRATQEDKDLLPFTYAFIMELLRFRPSTPLGLEHVNPVDSSLAGFKIPKNSRILFNLYAQNNDPKYWENPQEFNPNRFLDKNGDLITARLPSFVTFGLGRRACPGEKLAINNLFLMITRLIQNIRIELSTGSYSADLIPINILTGLFPKDYKIKCFSRK